MSQAGAQAWAFYREVAKNKVVWTIRDDSDFPTAETSDGLLTQPFWSSKSRAERIIKMVPTYSGFEPFEISWDDFCNVWVPRLTEDGLKVGVNWSGKRAVGYDFQPADLQAYVEAVIEDTE